MKAALRSWVPALLPLLALLLALPQAPRDALVIVLDDVGVGDLATAENIQVLAAAFLGLKFRTAPASHVWQMSVTIMELGG